MERLIEFTKRAPMRVFRNQQGVGLPLALFALVSLMGLLFTFLSLGSNEPLIARNHAEGSEARYIADAGIEWAFDALAGNPNWNAVLLGLDGLPNTADDGFLATSMPLPGLPAASGTFSVTVRNDTQPGDTQITGMALDPGGAFNDTNGRLIITSVGVVGQATRTITVSLRRIDLPPVVAALSLPGTQATTTFNGNSFIVNGNDTNLNDTAGPGSPVWGVAVANGNTTNENEVQRSLSGAQQDNVLGRQQNAGQPAYGDNTISPDAALTSSAVSNFVAAVKALADLSFTSTQARSLSFTNIGARCAADPAATTCWGTPSNPKLIYIKGDPNSTSLALKVSGASTGAGVLIVEDGDFAISGNFRWNGIIIVTGQNVGVSYQGGGRQTVYGAVISNETSATGSFKDALVSGNAKLLYSTEAVNLARQMRKLLAVSSWREV